MKYIQHSAILLRMFFYHTIMSKKSDRDCHKRSIKNISSVKFNTSFRILQSEIGLAIKLIIQGVESKTIIL